jgi:hypothetical protein
MWPILIHSTVPEFHVPVDDSVVPGSDSEEHQERDREQPTEDPDHALPACAEAFHQRVDSDVTLVLHQRGGADEHEQNEGQLRQVLGPGSGDSQHASEDHSQHGDGEHAQQDQGIQPFK